MAVETVVADTSALVSLAVPGADARHDADPDPLQFLLTGCHVVVPAVVRTELREIASYDDLTGAAAGNVLAADAHYDVRRPYDRRDTPDERPSFGVDPGETDAVVLANAVGADLLVADEFGSTDFAVLHAALAGPQLVTTPRLLRDYALNGHLSRERAVALLDRIATVRSWEESRYLAAIRARL